MQASLRRLLAARQREEAGFTLIEILVVIIILGVLAAIVIFAVGGLAGEGVDSACRTDGKSSDTAAEAYYAKNNTYPDDFEDLVAPDEFLKEAPNQDADQGKYYFEMAGDGSASPDIKGYESSTGGQCYPATTTTTAAP